MILNTRIWNETVNAAKAAASTSPAWLCAIERAVIEIEKAKYWAFDGQTLTIQSTTSKKLYRKEAMGLFNIGKFFSKDRDRQRERETQEREAENFELAPQGGFISVVKYALFAFFGYLNARLFITTVLGWEGWLTVTFALCGEGVALYCLRNFTRSTGIHKAALGVAGVAFTAFSFVHAVFSFFKLEQNAATSGAVKYYCESVAFPVLFSMLTIAAIALPLLHWRARVAAAQAKAQSQIAESRARMLAETARMATKRNWSTRASISWKSD